MHDELVARTVDGVALALDRVRARGDRRGVALCLHAMMTDGRYFGARRPPHGFAHSLAARGIDTVVADFRGHGRSPFARDWSFDDLVELDLPALVRATCDACGCAPGELAIVGHSLGGLVAVAALGTGRIPPPRRLVLAATSVWLGETMLRRAIMTTYRAAARAFGRAPIRALRVGTADEARGYVEQLAGWALAGRWTSLYGIDYREAARAIAAPAVAFCGGADWMCRPRDAEAIASALPACAPVRVVDGADHFTLFTRERPELRAWLADAIID